MTTSEEARQVPAERLRILEPDGTPDTGPAEPHWLAGSVQEFRRQLGDRGYPCVFGHQSLVNRQVWLTWTETAQPSALPAELTAFLERTDAAAGRPCLAVFLPPVPGGPDHRALHDQFWSVLDHLQDHDDREWPVGQPRDPDDPNWQFHFHGVPLFLFGMAPTHLARRSRNVGASMVVMFVPKKAFAGIEVATVAGNAARTGIRRRLEQWDAAPIHPSLGTLDAFSAEWKQYFLPDDASDLAAQCPLQDHRTAATQTGRVTG